MNPSINLTHQIIEAPAKDRTTSRVGTGIIGTQLSEGRVLPPSYLWRFAALILVSGLSFAHSAGAAEKLAIEPAYALPDYTKLKLVTDSPERLFFNDVALGDFNEDGRLDAVIQVGTPPYPGDVPFGAVVFLQDATGTLIEKASYVMPNTSVGITLKAGDFNEDGHLDLIGDDSGNDMILMLGKGDGTFKAPAFLELGAAGLFSIADLNGDQHLDLVAGNLDGTVGVFLGGGDGSFKLKMSLETQVQPYWIVRGQMMVGDVNGDKKLDVVVASLQNNSAGSGNLDVFLGNGDGTFQPVIRTPNVSALFGALGDFNGDGRLDYAGSSFSGSLGIWFGKGDGNFAKGKTYSAGLAGGVQVADLNRDGILDVIVSGDNGTIYLPQGLFLGNGDGTFRPKQSFTQADGFATMSLGAHFVDFNGDGWLDIVSIAAMGKPPYTAALSVALSHGVKRDPNLGSLLKVQFDSPGTAGPVVLEASNDLVTWTPRATNSTTTATWSVVDPTSGQSQRFYRTRHQ